MQLYINRAWKKRNERKQVSPKSIWLFLMDTQHPLVANFQNLVLPKYMRAVINP